MPYHGPRQGAFKQVGQSSTVRALFCGVRLRICGRTRTNCGQHANDEEFPQIVGDFSCGACFERHRTSLTFSLGERDQQEERSAPRGNSWRGLGDEAAGIGLTAGSVGSVTSTGQLKGPCDSYSRGPFAYFRAPTIGSWVSPATLPAPVTCSTVRSCPRRRRKASSCTCARPRSALRTTTTEHLASASTGSPSSPQVACSVTLRADRALGIRGTMAGPCCERHCRHPLSTCQLTPRRSLQVAFAAEDFHPDRSGQVRVRLSDLRGAAGRHRPDLMMYTLLHSVVPPVAKASGGPRCSASDKCRRTGAVILASNHLSFADSLSSRSWCRARSSSWPSPTTSRAPA